jgi:hypothetical protein
MGIFKMSDARGVARGVAQGVARVDVEVSN